MYTIILVHTIAKEGILSEKFEMVMAEKKNGVKAMRYMSAMDIHLKTSAPDTIRPRFIRKNAAAIIPAPAKKSAILQNKD